MLVICAFRCFYRVLFSYFLPKILHGGVGELHCTPKRVCRRFHGYMALVGRRNSTTFNMWRHHLTFVLLFLCHHLDLLPETPRNFRQLEMYSRGATFGWEPPGGDSPGPLRYHLFYKADMADEYQVVEVSESWSFFSPKIQRNKGACVDFSF